MKRSYIFFAIGLASGLCAAENGAALSDAQKLMLDVLNCYRDAQWRQTAYMEQAIREGELAPKDIFRGFAERNPDWEVNHSPRCAALRGQLDKLGRQHLAEKDLGGPNVDGI